MSENEELITRIEDFCAREKIAESTFGRRAVNDGKLVKRLRSGKTINLRTLRAIEDVLRGRVAA